MTYRVTRQKTCLQAEGRVWRGVLDSEAARPINSVPAKAKAAVTKTEQKPLNPFLNAFSLKYLHRPCQSSACAAAGEAKLGRWYLSPQNVS